MGTPVIEAKGLTKRYGSVLAVDHVDLAIAGGEVFGLLGPNGSGKTTTIMMMMGLTDVSAGEVRVLGLDPARQPLEVKRRIGYLPENVGFYDELTARQNLRYSGRLGGLRGEALEARIDASLDRVELTELGNRRVRTFSRGLRQRLGVADALLREPRIVILDEPTNGLDPHATREFLELIRSLKAEGITILLSSHLLDRVQAICDRVALFRSGRIALMGSVHQLALEVLGSGHRIELEAEGPGLEERLRALPGVEAVQRDGPSHFALDCALDLRAEVAALAAGDGGRLLSLAIKQPSLDEVYDRYFEQAGEEVAHAA
jgi:ABC-2 type transport system ATP-binding protein